jgi:ribonucleotide reductase alpha subunit
VQAGIANELLNPEIGRFDLGRLAAALKPERDLQFDYLGLQTLYDRYSLHVRGTRFERPQAFFMRVACGSGCARSTRGDQGQRAAVEAMTAPAPTTRTP